MIQVWRTWCERCGYEDICQIDTEIDGGLCTVGMCRCGADEFSGYHIEKIAEYGKLKDFK